MACEVVVGDWERISAKQLNAWSALGREIHGVGEHTEHIEPGSKYVAIKESPVTEKFYGATLSSLSMEVLEQKEALAALSKKHDDTIAALNKKHEADNQALLKRLKALEDMLGIRG